MTIRSFDSIEDMFSAIEANRQSADARVLPWQTEIKPGDFLLGLDTTTKVFIWIEVLDGIEEERKAGGTEEELETLRERYSSSLKHYRFARCYSFLCHDGELGDFHVSTVMCKITLGQFEAARAVRWPASGPEVLEILKLAETVPQRNVLFPDYFS